MLASSASYAEGFTAEDCETYEELAKIVMQSRQLNHPMNALTKGEGKELTKALVIEAYKQPLYSTAKYKRQAVIQFANEVRSACLRTIK